jgi:hypothetical protein
MRARRVFPQGRHYLDERRCRRMKGNNTIWTGNASASPAFQANPFPVLMVSNKESNAARRSRAMQLVMRAAKEQRRSRHVNERCGAEGHLAHGCLPLLPIEHATDRTKGIG